MNGADNPTPTVLVADDEEAVRAIARLALERAGFAVLTAVDGLEAVQIFGERDAHIAAVLLDLRMPRMDGAEAFTHIRERRPDAPVVISSGGGEAEFPDSPAGLPSAFIQKPYLPTTLIQIITQVIEQRPTDV